MELHFPLAHQNCLLDYKGFEIPSSLGKALSAGLWAPGDILSPTLFKTLIFSHCLQKTNSPRNVSGSFTGTH